MSSPFVIPSQHQQSQGADTKAEHDEKRSEENGDNVTEAPPNDDNLDPNKNGKRRQIYGIRWLVICAALYVSCILYGLDTTIAADVQGSVIERFGHVEQLAWVGAGFPLGSVCVILPLETCTIISTSNGSSSQPLSSSRSALLFAEPLRL